MQLSEARLSRAAESLSQAIRFPTISRPAPQRRDEGAFDAFHAWMESRYPRLMALEGFRIPGAGRCVILRGSDPKAEAILCLAHIDVVPAEGDSGWSRDPWGGQLDAGVVWGRGAMDDKGVLVCLLEAMDEVLSTGLKPGRSVVLAFGEDEETGGDSGAALLGAELARRGWLFDYCLDEGGLVLHGAVGFLKRPAALIGVSEKGHVNFLVTAKGQSGHASTPPRRQAAMDLAKGITRLAKRPFPPRLNPITIDFLRRLGQAVGGLLGAILSHPRLHWPIISRILLSQAKTAAILQSTMAFTMLEGSSKANVLPDSAAANINVRLLPGDSIEYAKQYISSALSSLKLDVEINPGESINEALPLSPICGPAWDELSRLCARHFPNALVLPYLCLAGTDTRHYLAVSRAIYRFNPFEVDQTSLDSIHSADEGLSLETMAKALDYYASLMAGEAI